MQTLKKVIIFTSLAGFILTFIGMLVPGWVVFHLDIHKMAENSLKKQPTEVQRQYKEQQRLINEQNPAHTDVKNLDFGIGIFFIRYCFEISVGSMSSRPCVILSSSDVIEMVKALMANQSVQANGAKQNFAAMFESIQQYGSLESAIRIYTAIIVVTALLIIQSFVTTCLVIVYSCKKHPKKVLGYSGSVSSIILGSFILLVVMGYAISYSRASHMIAQDIGDAGDLKFPYSTIIFSFGSVLLILTGIMLIRVTTRSKDQFSYEMMVIDGNKGGNTYVARS